MQGTYVLYRLKWSNSWFLQHTPGLGGSHLLPAYFEPVVLSSLWVLSKVSLWNSFHTFAHCLSEQNSQLSEASIRSDWLLSKSYGRIAFCWRVLRATISEKSDVEGSCLSSLSTNNGLERKTLHLLLRETVLFYSEPLKSKCLANSQSATDKAPDLCYKCSSVINGQGSTVQHAQWCKSSTPVITRLIPLKRGTPSNFWSFWWCSKLPNI